MIVECDIKHLGGQVLLANTLYELAS
jgi:hypothetical protein